jgi:hypothetical protein
VLGFVFGGGGGEGGEEQEEEGGKQRDATFHFELGLRECSGNILDGAEREVQMTYPGAAFWQGSAQDDSWCYYNPGARVELGW